MFYNINPPRSFIKSASLPISSAMTRFFSIFACASDRYSICELSMVASSTCGTVHSQRYSSLVTCGCAFRKSINFPYSVLAITVFVRPPTSSFPEASGAISESSW